tara:strand:- start:575 stop:862 length:288 start_codon:yes stop_codon:yes gene_type:complete
MSETNKKFTKEELEKLKDIQQRYANVQIKFGQLAFAKFKIDDEIKKIEEFEIAIREDFLKIKSEEDEFTKSITEKYGEGSLDPESGTFTPQNLNK